MKYWQGLLLAGVCAIGSSYVGAAGKDTYACGGHAVTVSDSGMIVNSRAYTVPVKVTDQMNIWKRSDNGDVAALVTHDERKVFGIAKAGETITGDVVECNFILGVN